MTCVRSQNPRHRLPSCRRCHNPKLMLQDEEGQSTAGASTGDPKKRTVTRELEDRGCDRSPSDGSAAAASSPLSFPPKSSFHFSPADTLLTGNPLPASTSTACGRYGNVSRLGEARPVRVVSQRVPLGSEEQGHACFPQSKGKELGHAWSGGSVGDAAFE